MIYCLLVSAYTLAVTGPLVSASRYRMPMEPVMIALTAVGVVWLWQRARGGHREAT